MNEYNALIYRDAAMCERVDGNGTTVVCAAMHFASASGEFHPQIPYLAPYFEKFLDPPPWAAL